MPKRATPATAASPRAVQCARKLIEHLLKEMQLMIENPDYMAPEQWERLFGPRQSMVANIQKLVSALGALPLEPARRTKEAQTHIPPITAAEMALLRAWLADGETQTGAD